jgi:hypothetical protein
MKYWCGNVELTDKFWDCDVMVFSTFIQWLNRFALDAGAVNRTLLSHMRMRFMTSN